MKQLLNVSKFQVSSLVLVINMAFPVVAENSVVMSTTFSKLKVKNENSQPVQNEVDSLGLGDSGNVVLNQRTDDVVSMVSEGLAPEVVLPKVFEDGAYKFYEDTGVVEFSLVKGLLKTQVEELLMHHHSIDSTDDIQWKASSNFIWPNSYTVSGKSFDHVLNSVLAPYRLVSDFKGNGNVIISKL